MSEPANGTVEFRRDGIVLARLLLRDRVVPRVGEQVLIVDQMFTVGALVWSIDPGDGPDVEMSMLQSVVVVLR